MATVSHPASPRLSVRKLAIFWRVFALDAALLVVAALLLALTPITISAPITQSQAIAVALGLVILVGANGLLLWLTLRPLRRLAEMMNSVDLLEPGKRLQIDGSGEVSEVIATFNRTLTRLEAERREASTIAFRAQESERRRIARELHDEIGQNLTGVLLFLRRAEETTGTERAEAIGDAQDTARAALEQLRRVDELIRPSVLQELGLPTAIQALADTHQARTGTPVHVDVDHTLQFDATASLAIYRIAQEAFTNIARHADCSRASVALRAVGGDEIELVVGDDGVGLGDVQVGAGLQGMRERAVIIGGMLRVESPATGGTTVTLIAPVHVDAAGRETQI